MLQAAVQPVLLVQGVDDQFSFLFRDVLFHEIKRKIGHQLPAQVILAALLLATFFAKEQALHVMQNLNANQNLIHSNYFSEIHC